MTTDLEKQEGQKTVIAFAVGLLIGGLLVWAFSGSPETTNEPTTHTEEDTTSETSSEQTDTMSDPVTLGDKGGESSSDTPEIKTGDASVTLSSVAAGSVLTLEGAVFPTEEGWIGVRTYTNQTLGSILGVSRYSQKQGLVPSTIELLVPTVSGRDYAVVFFAENGDMDFNPAQDAQLDTALTTFTAE